MRRSGAGILAALLVLSASGCFRVGVTVGAEIPEDRVARIVPGVTTKDDILRWFGAPAEATDGEIFARLFDVGEIAAEDLVALPFSDMLVYEITDAEARILMTILFNWARVELDRDRLVIFFDERDRVLYFGVTRQRTDREEDQIGVEEDLEGPEFEHEDEEFEPEALDPASEPAPEGEAP